MISSLIQFVSGPKALLPALACIGHVRSSICGKIASADSRIGPLEDYAGLKLDLFDCAVCGHWIMWRSATCEPAGPLEPGSGARARFKASAYLLQPGKAPDRYRSFPPHGVQDGRI